MDWRATLPTSSPEMSQALISQGMFREDEKLGDTMLHHLLQALDYLASKDMMHRDVKPGNILYSFAPGVGYHYQLADFGIAKLVNDTRTSIGTEPFKAPGAALHLAARQESSPRINQPAMQLRRIRGFRLECLRLAINVHKCDGYSHRLPQADVLQGRGNAHKLVNGPQAGTRSRARCLLGPGQLERQ